MTAFDKVSFLKKVPLFKNLNDKQLKTIAGCLVERKFKAGDMIVKQGTGGEGFFMVSEGTAEAVFKNSEGEQVVVNSFEPTDFFGELALLSEGTRTASIVAKEDVTTQALTRWDFRAVLVEDGEMAVAVLEELAARFRTLLSTM
jgi:CRP-like cAMP-binding protein